MKKFAVFALLILGCASSPQKNTVLVHVTPSTDLCIRDGERLEELTAGAMGRFAPGARDVALRIAFDGIGFEFVYGRAREFVSSPLFSPKGSYAISEVGGRVIEAGPLPHTGSLTETECLMKTATWLARRVGAIRPASGSSLQ